MNDDPCQRVRYFYDSFGSNTGTYGHVAAVTTGGDDIGCTVQQFTERFSYNPAGHVTAKTLERAQPGIVTDWTVGYTYNLFGQVASTQYPNYTDYLGTHTGALYTVGFDNMQRPATLTQSFGGISGTHVVTNVNYNAAGQPTQTALSTNGSDIPNAQILENRSYNVLNQLTGIVAGSSQYPGINVSYNYPTAMNNNGQIVSEMDGFAGQTVAYGYDALKRLISATGSGGSTWGQTYTYDGFGNMTSKVNSGAISSTVSFGVDASTNRLSGNNICYDPAGNMVSDQNGGGCSNPNYAYDASNRLVRAGTGSSAETYQYGADNKRLRRTNASSEWIYFYGAMGETIAVINNGFQTYHVHFAGRFIAQMSPAYGPPGIPGLVFTDRLGSVRGTFGPATSTGGRFLPYGEEITTSPNDTVTFGTYTRDGATGLDYADQRFYTSQFGRFTSADRFKQAAKTNDSGSWNKYSYTRGDPVNRADRRGTCDDEMTDYFDSGNGGGDGSGGCVGDGDGGGGGGDICSAVGLVSNGDGTCVAPSNGEINAPVPKCPLVGIVGNFTDDPASSTPVHDWFAPDVAILIDQVFALLNKEGITPVLEDGFRTTGDQADRKKKYPIAADLSWHEIGRAIDVKPGQAHFADIEKAFTDAGFRDGVSFADRGHFDFAGGQKLTQAGADNCTKEHPNGY